VPHSKADHGSDFRAGLIANFYPMIKPIKWVICALAHMKEGSLSPGRGLMYAKHLTTPQPGPDLQLRKRFRLSGDHTLEKSVYTASNDRTPSGSRIHGNFERVKM
jgi:hypothetical protein